MGEKTGRIHVQTSLVSDYIFRESENGERLILLLHGYAQSGAQFYEKLKPALPKDDLVLVPNGPFPIPRKKDRGYEMGFSWYFYDPFTKKYFIKQDIACEFLKALFSELKLNHLPLTVIGFSQGGYLAPFLVEHLPGLKHVIGINCEFIDAVEGLKGLDKLRIDSINGVQDDIIKEKEARLHFERVRLKTASGEFYLLEDTGHKINEQSLNTLRQILAR